MTPPSKTAPPPAAPAYGRKRFDDEDVEDDVKDDWDDDEEEPAKPDVSNLQPIKKKSTIKQKIKEREEREKQRAEMGSDSEEDEEEDPIERKRREKEAQIKADVENAANLLGTSKIAADEGVSALQSAKPSSKEDWEKFSEDIYRTLIKSHSTKPGFDKNFVPHFTKLLSTNLRDVDCRKLSTEWKKIADEKTKEEREKKLGGGKKKAEKPKTVGTASAKNVYDTKACEYFFFVDNIKDAHDLTDGDEALDDGDDLDFM